MRPTVIHADSRDALREIADATFSACVTDPPYALTQGKKGGTGVASVNLNSPAGRARITAGFMGKAWDTGETAFDPVFWAEVLRVLKPGAHLIAFGGTRTYHRLVCAIEDGGFEIRDQIAWLFGSGFPKSRNIGNGWGTALKPAHEPIVLARKPLIGTVAANVLQHGSGALNIDATRIATDENLNGGAYQSQPSDRHDGTESWRFRNGGRSTPPGDERTGAALGMYQEGKTTGLEFVQPPGRWPANVVHDGSEEVLRGFPDSDGQQRSVGPEHGAKPSVNTYGDYGARDTFNPRGDTGSAARFFYTAKADADDRLGSKHPTVKPVDLMAYLLRLVTPPGGLVLDPFAGSGTTGMACMREGFECVLIEREAEYVADIKHRIAHVRGEDAPLFGSAS